MSQQPPAPTLGEGLPGYEGKVLATEALLAGAPAVDHRLTYWRPGI